MLETIETLFEQILDLQDPLLPFRQKARKRLSEIGWPKHKDEAFQYIPLKDLALPMPAERPAQSQHSNAPFRIVFIDGYFSEADSILPSGIVAMPLSKAVRSYAIFLQNRMQRLIKEEKDPFALLNALFQGSGLFLYVPPQTSLESPIRIEHYAATQTMASPRLMLYLGRESQLEFSSHFEPACFTNAFFDALLDENAKLTLRTAQIHSEGKHFQAIRVSQKRNSTFQSYQYSNGATLSRTSLCVQLLEEGSEALLQGLWKLHKDRHSHIHAQIEHLAPNTRSRQHFKGILYDASRSSFEGKIFVDPIAQKTEAYQLNNNLLMSDTAAAFAKPNLEILADDVKASHGATMAQVDPEDLFYLNARGLSPREAQEMLVEGFVQELSSCLPQEFQ